MIDHAVLLRPKASIPQQDIELALAHVRALIEVIPGIVSIAAGSNLSVRHQGYTYGFIMRFENEEALKIYAEHEAHKPVSEDLMRACESIIDFDLAEP
jgi:hypothetical protein